MTSPVTRPVTRRGAVAGLVAAAAASRVDAASLAATSAQAASNFFGVATYGSQLAAIAAAEAKTAPGGLFAVDDGVGNLLYRVRTGDGSLLVAQTVTAASLDADDGAGRLGWKRSAAAYRRQQSAINQDLPPHLFDVTPAAMHAAILAGSSKEDITPFLNSARAAAISEGFAVVQLPPGQAVISDTIDLQTGRGSFKGVKFQGPGVESLTLLQALGAADAEKPLFRMLGGSGTQTNKALSGMTVRPVDAAHNGRGKLLQIDGQCYTFCSDLVGERLHTLIELLNRHPGAFTEMNAFHNIRSLDCRRGIAMIRDGGSESFHGNAFFGTCQINIPDGGCGLWLEGRSGVAYYYNAEADLRLFGGTGQRTAIRCQNAITRNVILNVTCEDPCVIEVADTASRLHSQGRFSSTHAIAFKCAADGQVVFDNLRNGGSFASPALASLRPAVMPAAMVDHIDNGEIPALFRLQGPNVEALGLACYDAGGDNGVYIGKIGFGGSLEDFMPQVWFDPAGGVRFLNGGAQSAGMIGGRLNIGGGNMAPLPRRARGAMLIVRDEDIGGVGIFRIDEAMGVKLDSGNAQFVAGLPKAGMIGVTANSQATLIHNGNRAMRTVEYMLVGMVG